MSVIGTGPISSLSSCSVRWVTLSRINRSLERDGWYVARATVTRGDSGRGCCVHSCVLSFIYFLPPFRLSVLFLCAFVYICM